MLEFANSIVNMRSSTTKTSIMASIISTHTIRVKVTRTINKMKTRMKMKTVT